MLHGTNNLCRDLSLQLKDEIFEIRRAQLTYEKSPDSSRHFFKREFDSRVRLQHLLNSLRRRVGKKRATKTRDSRRGRGNMLKIQITYRNYFCPAMPEDLRRGNKLAHWRRTWRHKSRRTYERPFININKPYVSVGHNDTIVARSIPSGFSRC